jgi:hypothetical protein
MVTMEDGTQQQLNHKTPRAFIDSIPRLFNRKVMAR